MTSACKRSLRIVTIAVGALIAASLLLPAAPDDARAADLFAIAKHADKNKHPVAFSRAGKLKRSLEKNFPKLFEYVDKATNVKAVAEGDGKAQEEAFQGAIGQVGMIAVDYVDPTDGRFEEYWNRAKSAKDKIGRFFREAPDAVAEAKAEVGERLGSVRRRIGQNGADARSALAVAPDEKPLYESGTGILDRSRPLPTPKRTTTSSTRSGAWDQDASRSSSLSWSEKDFVKRHYDYRHCWGVFDDDHDSYECMAETDAKRRAAAGAQRAQPNKPSKEKFDWSSEWTVKGDGLPVWDRSNSRYDDEDRDAARVAVYASRCWGEHYATRDNVLLYNLMKSRMKRNECPQEEVDEAESKGKKSDYEAALSGALGEEETVSEDEDYHGALRALEAWEEDQLRLAKQQEREREGSLAERRRLEAELRSQEEKARRADQAARMAKQASRQAENQEDMRRYMQIIEQTNRLIGKQLSNSRRSPRSSGKSLCPQPKNGGTPNICY